MKKLISLILFIIVAIVLYFSISFLYVKEDKKTDKVYDVTRVLKIDDKELDITYISGNMIDENISYGNILTKKIEICNDNDVELLYSLTIKEVEISNEQLTYSLKVANDDENYTYINKNESLVKDAHLGYNLLIEPKTKLYITVEFKANYEKNDTTLKGVLNIEDNLSEADLFITNTRHIVNEVEDKINTLNGITKSGYYILNMQELSNELNKYRGYIIIDAYNISEIKTVLFIYSDNYMLKNYIYSTKLDKNDLKTKDDEITSLNKEEVCDLYTNRSCNLFSSLKYNTLDNRSDFYQETKRIIDLTKDKFNDKKINIVYDIKEDIDNKSKVRGYILINNKDVKEPEYYLYLTNDIYMISGYNLTKNGDYEESSSTIREYNETAFRLSAKDKKTVCSFSGVNNCVDINENPIK